MRNVFYFAIIIFLSISAQGQQKSGSSAHNQALTMFPYWFEGTGNEESQDPTMQQLIGLDNPTPSWPPFPRTWFELGLDKTQTTTTGWSATVTGFQGGIPLIGSSINIAASASGSIQYKYNVNTTFVAITSLRPIVPEATENTETRMGILPLGEEEQEEDSNLRPILKWNEDETRNYFNVSKKYPITGLCKFEMTLKIARSKSAGVQFLVLTQTEEYDDIQTVTYARYSNFFEIKGDIPTSEYLRTTCDREFKQAARYLAEVDFNNAVKEVHAHYHPNAICVLPKSKKAALDPNGDKSCMDWFYNPRFVMGSYRRDNVPRCVVGSQGIPTCVLKARENGSCPVYYADGNITDKRPMDGSGKMVTEGNYSHFSCDKGLSCKPRSGGEWKDERLSWYTPYTGVEATCQK